MPEEHQSADSALDPRQGRRRQRLLRLTRLAVYTFVLGLLYVLFDFAIDWRPATVQDSYRFRLPALAFDQPRILRQDNLALVVIRRSPALMNRLQLGADELQDARSARSRQPAGFDPEHRAREAEYFVAYAIGTDFGCPLKIEAEDLRESCGAARYDFAGRAYRGERRFSNLPVPDYTFSENFRTLTVFP